MPSADPLPTFLVIGAMKAGTTSLWQYLRTHPDVFMPDEKEIDFFVAEKHWDRGLDWYRSVFAGAGEAGAVGEASTNYSKHPLFGGVAGRIARTLPGVRLVYMVRHPIERMRSHYLHALSEGWEHRPVERALFEVPQYLEVSRYAFQLDRYLEHFAPDRILVITSEALRDDRAATVRRVFGFLGVDDSWTPPGLDREHHPTGDKPLPRGGARAALARLAAPARVRGARARTVAEAEDLARLSPAAEERLAALLRDDVTRLRALLGPGFDGWGLA